MNTAIHLTTTVLPGGKIEITAPELVPGTIAQVTVTIDEQPATPGLHVLDIVKELPGHRLFKTVADVDAHLREERDAWDS